MCQQGTNASTKAGATTFQLNRNAPWIQIRAGCFGFLIPCHLHDEEAATNLALLVEPPWRLLARPQAAEIDTQPDTDSPIRLVPTGLESAQKPWPAKQRYTCQCAIHLRRLRSHKYLV